MKDLEQHLKKLRAEADYLYEKLNSIVLFNASSVDKDNLANLESQLDTMKIDLTITNEYFVSAALESEIRAINNEIDGLLNQVGTLQGEIGNLNSYIRNKIENRKKDINEFLDIVGFRYRFDVKVDGEDKVRAVLNFVLPDGEDGNESYGKHLSWGERHAFVLILFDAISQNAELIILDDPISSFDNDKKYAIISRLFKTGDKDNSLYQRTVLMLTHDFEPVIDYIKVRSDRQAPTTVCAIFFENIKGQLKCTPIRKDYDLISSIVLLKEIASDDFIDIAARIGSLRKFIEHQYKYPDKESEAYNILSSLIHGRSKPTFDL